MALTDKSVIAPILDQVCHHLSAHEDKYFRTQTERLAKENNRLRRQANKQPTTGFIFDGVAYVLPEHNFSSPMLHGMEAQLEGEMEALLAEQKARAREVKTISQMVFLICKDTVTTFQDLRDLLPECLVPAFPQLAQFEREREPAFSIRNNPKLMEKWNSVLPRIEYYTATRLLY